jgi:ABC-2 type transport system ATP-binding protein
MINLQCTDLTKSYGKTNAVHNLNLELKENTIYGLLGRNGAGKTTLMNLITGRIFPDHGEITVGGMRLKRGESPQNICYIRQDSLYFSGGKIIEMLEYASAFHNNWDWNFAYKLIETFKLNPNQKIRHLSDGMVSLIGNIIGLASREPITIYDEPVIGLDVLMRDKFYRSLMEDYAENPRTILLSTHLIDEVAKVVERIYIIEAGTILLHDDVDNIRTHSHLLKGSGDAIEKFTNGKRVIYRESYGKGALAAIYDTIGDEDKAQASKLGISIAGIPLQKFFAYFIEGGEQFD